MPEQSYFNFGWRPVTKWVVDESVNVVVEQVRSGLRIRIRLTDGLEIIVNNRKSCAMRRLFDIPRHRMQ